MKFDECNVVRALVTQYPFLSSSCWTAPESGSVRRETLPLCVSAEHKSTQRHPLEHLPAVARIGLHSLGATERCCVRGGNEALYLNCFTGGPS